MDNGLFYIAAIVAGCIAVLACMALTPGQRLVVAAGLAIPQVYVPGLPLSVAEGWLALMAALAIVDERVWIPKLTVVRLVFTVGTIYASAHFWSENADDGLILTVRIMLYGALICYAHSVAMSQPSYLRIALKWMMPWIVLQSALTFLFRANAALEISFLRSTVGQLLIGPAARDLFTISPNNVLDPAKAGGLFVNGNVASMFGGVAAFLLFAAVRHGWSKWYYAWAFLALGSAIATGSKTGVSLALILPVLCIILSKASNSRSSFTMVPLVAAVVPLVLILPNWIESVFPSFSEKSVSAYGTRVQIWDAGRTLFSESPLMGLGHGGWAQSTAGMAGLNGFPPHNLIIDAWSTAGIFAALAVILLLAATITWCMRSLFTATKQEYRTASACTLCGFLWIYIHGMGDNTTFYGESRTMILAIMFFGLSSLANSPKCQLGNEMLAVPEGSARA